MPVLINGTTGISGAPLQRGTAVASTSGANIDFTGIPSWVSRITIMFANVRKSSTSAPLFQMIVAGTPVTSGYLGTGISVSTAANATLYTTGFGIRALGSTDVLHGSLVLTLVDTSNTWTASGAFGLSNVAVAFTVGGSIALSGTVTGVRITTTGSDTYNQGTINIIYE